MAAGTCLMAAVRTDEFSQGINLTRYYVFSGHPSAEATETNAQATIRTGGTLKNIYLRLVTNGNTGTSTFRSRVNVANGAQSVSIAASTSGEFEDTSNTDTIAAGDEINASLVTANSGAAMTVSIVGALFIADGNNTVSICCTHDTENKSDASATYFDVLIGNQGLNTSAEENSQFQINTSGTLQNSYVRISSNGHTTASTMRTRINGGNGNVVMSIGASATGAFEDTTNTDSVVANDLLNWSFATGATLATMSVEVMKIEFSSSSGYFFHICGSSDTTEAVTSNATSYRGISGEMGAATEPAEGDTQTDANISATVSNLEVYISANTHNATSNYRFRVNDANGNQVVSVSASATGLFEDTSNTDSVVAADEVNYSLAAGNDAGTASVRLMGTQWLAGDATAAATTVEVSFSRRRNPAVYTPGPAYYFEKMKSRISPALV